MGKYLIMLILVVVSLWLCNYLNRYKPKTKDAILEEHYPEVVEDEISHGEGITVGKDCTVHANIINGQRKTALTGYNNKIYDNYNSGKPLTDKE